MTGKDPRSSRWPGLIAFLLLWVGIGMLFWGTVRSGGLLAPTSVPASRPTSTPLPSRTPQVTPGPEATPTPEALSVPPDLADALDRLERQVADWRQLAILQPVPRQGYTRAAWEQRLASVFLAAYPNDAVEQQAFWFRAMGWLPPQANLWENYYRLFDAMAMQRFAFYDPTAQSMALNREAPLDGTAKATYVRAFVHALQAQNFDWTDFGVANIPSFSCLALDDACRARAALTVGDALWSEAFWVAQGASAEERRAVQEAAAQARIPAETPWFVQRLAAFPYQTGVNFVAYLYSRGGWAAVDAAYATPPVSSEQVLHPERYPQTEPVEVSLPDLAPILGEGWEAVQQGTLGEWGLLAWLAYGADPTARVDEGMARDAADGWRGDAFALYHRRSDGATLLASWVQWRDGAERYEFTKALARYLGGRTGSTPEVRSGLTYWAGASEVHVLYAGARTTLWVVAPDEATAEAVVSAVRAQEAP